MPASPLARHRSCRRPWQPHGVAVCSRCRISPLLAQRLGAYFVNPGLARNAFGQCPIVTSDKDNVSYTSIEHSNRLRHRVLYRIGDTYKPASPTIDRGRPWIVELPAGLGDRNFLWIPLPQVVPRATVARNRQQYRRPVRSLRLHAKESGEQRLRSGAAIGAGKTRCPHGHAGSIEGASEKAGGTSAVGQRFGLEPRECTLNLCASHGFSPGAWWRSSAATMRAALRAPQT